MSPGGGQKVRHEAAQGAEGKEGGREGAREGEMKGKKPFR